MHNAPAYRPTITPCEHTKSEWRRLAVQAYASGSNAMGIKFSVAGAWRTGEPMPLAMYDDLQAIYRAWLIDGWIGVARALAAPFQVRADRDTAHRRR